MPWWLIVLMVVGGCVALAIIMMIPLAFAWGAAIGALSISRDR